MNDKREVSLASVVAGYSAAVIAFGMGIYAVYQYVAMPNRTVLGLILEHSLHVIVLGLLIYVTLYAVLYRKVVRPIRDLYLKLYAITRGNLSSIDIESNIVEIAQIAEGVQILLDGMDQSVPKVSLAELSNRTQKIRSIAKEPDALDPPAKDFLMNVANEIDDVVRELSLTKHPEQQVKVQ
jgi:nitrate/nitrite-specific signal transduction histidine kinase